MIDDVLFWLAVGALAYALVLAIIAEILARFRIVERTCRDDGRLPISAE